MGRTVFGKYLLKKNVCIAHNTTAILAKALENASLQSDILVLSYQKLTNSGITIREGHSVTDIIPISTSSFRVVEPELYITLQDASGRYEAFIADNQALDQLNECQKGIAQIEGVLKLFECPGALPLAQEMNFALQALLAANGEANRFYLSALSHAFVILPCYLEYIIEREQAVPQLVLPFINELRAAQGKPLLLESEQAAYQFQGQLNLAASGKQDITVKQVKHWRQMYQLGLLGLLREENIKAKLQLMHRAMQRLAQASTGRSIRGQWLLAEALFEALLAEDLAYDFTRKRVFSQLDGELRKLEKNSEATELSLDGKLLSELVYLLALSASNSPAAKEIAQAIELPSLANTDKTIQVERRIMHGPDAQTIAVMVAALREELLQSKEILEIAAQAASGSADFSKVAAVFQRTADILQVIGLTQPSQVMADMQQQIQALIDQNTEEVDKEKLLFLADGLLYIESSLAKLNRFDLSFANEVLDEKAKQKLMNKSQLDEAEGIVLEQAEESIRQAKKEITSFSEAAFEKSHLEPVLQSLSEVRGAMQILSHQRAANVLASCIQFVQAILNENADEKRSQTFLEVMADVLISIEYYLSEIAIGNPAPDSALQVAAHDLNELGFTVEG